MKPRFIHIEGKKYKDGIFSAGLIKNSPHKADRIYLRINDWFFHLRDDEVFAIISALSNALWSDWTFRDNKDSKVVKTLKWLTLKELQKEEKTLK